jgi:hypothetical protein
VTVSFSRTAVLHGVRWLVAWLVSCSNYNSNTNVSTMNSVGSFRTAKNYKCTPFLQFKWKKFTRYELL